MSITLKAARVNKELTQETAAQRIGVTKDTLSNWERGVSYPNAIQIRCIEELYDVQFNELIFLSKDTIKS